MVHADPQRVIDLLSHQIAVLTKDNAILTSMVESLTQEKDAPAVIDEP
jgi:hypothetical protein